MKILFVTQWFQPEQFYKGVPFARALMERGHEVQVLTGFPNYPTGKIYPGYKIKFFQKEILDGIEVIRVPLYPSHDSNAVKRIANYGSFAITAAILGPWLTKKPDVIYVYHPPPTTYLPSFVLKMLYRVPVVYDIQDFWPETLAATGMLSNSLCLKLVDLYCKTFYKAASKIVVLSPGFKQKLIEKGVPKEKIKVIYNWSVDSQIAEVERDEKLAEELGFLNKFNFLFAGNMGKAQNLSTLLEAADLLKNKCPEIQFVMIGGGVELGVLRSKASEMQLNNVRFLPRRPRSEIGQILSLANVLLVHLKDDPLFAITIPSKIQAYLAVGRPILAAVSGDAAEIIQQSGGGMTCLPDNAEQLAETAERFYQMHQKDLEAMGKKGKQYYLENMSMETGVKHFEEVFKSMV